MCVLIMIALSGGELDESRLQGIKGRMESAPGTGVECNFKASPIHRVITVEAFKPKPLRGSAHSSVR
jgi:hypothetical protein